MSNEINFDRYLSSPPIYTPRYTATPGIDVPTNVYGYTTTPEDELNFDQYLSDGGDSEVSKWESFLRGAGQGVTFGFEDEIRGGILGGFDALTTDQSFGDAYTTRRDEIRALNEAAREANAGAYFGGELVGGIASGVAAAPLTGGASFAGGAARMAGTLGAQGAVAGLGYSEADTAGGMAKDAAIGGAIGGGLGTGAAYGMRALGRAVPTEAIGKATSKLGQRLVSDAETAAGRRVLPEVVPDMVMDAERFGRLGRWAMNNKVFQGVNSPEDLQRNVVKRTNEVYDSMFSEVNNPFAKAFKSSALKIDTLADATEEVGQGLRRRFGNQFDYDKYEKAAKNVTNKIYTSLDLSDGDTIYQLKDLVKLQKELARNIDFGNLNPSPEELVYRMYYTKFNDVIADSIEDKSVKAMYNTMLRATEEGGVSPELQSHMRKAQEQYLNAVRENADMLRTGLDTITAGSVASRPASQIGTTAGTAVGSATTSAIGAGLGYIGGGAVGDMFPEYRSEIQMLGAGLGGVGGGITGATSNRISDAAGRIASGAVDRIGIQGRAKVGEMLGGTPRKTINTVGVGERVVDLYKPSFSDFVPSSFGKFGKVLEKAREQGAHHYAVTYQALFNQNQEFRELVRKQQEENER
jgi:hypothetical protein